MVETDSIAALVSHVREAGLVAVAPDHLLARLGIDHELLAIPLEQPQLEHEVGLVVADREPTPPFVAALWAAAQAMRT